MKKNVLLVINLCITVLLFCNTVLAQAPTGVFAKASTAPQIDGVIDAVWADATAYNIDKPMKNETPSLGASGETTWKAMWNNDGVYILLNVTDDVFFPNWAVTPAGNNWEYDKPEIYFDVNPVLADGFGPGTSVAANAKGHYQVAPGFPQGKVDGTKNVQSDGISYAFLVTGNNYVAEYFVPFSKFLDKDGKQVKMNATIGFDVQLIDRDVTAVTKSRAVWANTNAAGAGESYTNMNACGTVTLQGGDAFVYATALTLNTGGTITTDNGTLQMAPVFEPANADNKNLKWSVVAGTGMATISSTGLLTAVADGTVTVKATTTDGSMLTATTEVVISGQKINKNEVWNGLNLIKNWNFDTDLSSWSNWVDGNSQVAPAIVDGVCVMKVNKATDGAAWHYQFNQSGMTAAPNVAYTLKFKSWANVDATPCSVDFEDIAANGNKRYGTSTDVNAVAGASEWKYNVGTTPQWFTFHVVFDKMVASTVQKLQWMNSLSLATISLDSVLLVKDEYLVVKADKITLNNGGKITTKGGTLQMTATVEPADAANKNVTWSVSPEGIATISPEGLLTAVASGTVTVKATAADGSLTEATTDVVISGQLNGKELWSSSNNLIKNWNFDTDMTSWGGWVDGTPAGMVKPAVVDGVAVMKVSKSADAWHYQHSQSPLTAEANVPYTLKFKSWATADNTPCAVDFESNSAITPAKGGDQYARYGTTTDAEAVKGESEWHYNVNTTPQWFTFHVTFDKMIPTTIQKIQWMLSLSNETISLDSVLLTKDEALVPVNAITLNTGGTITANRGTLQMTATVAPENATDKKLTWSVSPEGIATINANGLLSALSDGTVTVKATAADGSLVEATTDVVISGQVAVKDLWNSSYNLIKNWNFDTDMTSWGGWVDTNPAGMVKPAVVDGVAVMKVGKSADNWHYQHSQAPLTAEPNVAYTLKFKSWASADNTPCAVDFESNSAITPAKGGDQYARYGATTDPESSDLRSEWHYNVGTAPQWFTFHVTFDKMIPTTIQKIQWMLSLSNETISLDSVLLVKDDYLNPEVSPLANAGADQSVNEGATVTLDGSKSSAPTDKVLSYRWVAPAGITLSSTTEAKPTFTAPEVTEDKTYTLTLVVSYDKVKPIADQVVVTVKQVNKVPVANAGADQSVNEGATVTLDASASADPDKTALTYLWTAPEGITLSSATVAKPTFTAPEVTADKTYTFSLVVNDGTVNSIMDEVVVTVKQVDKAPYIKLPIEDVAVDKGAAVKTIDLSTVFADDDLGDVLTYTVTNSNDEVVTAFVASSNLTLTFSTTKVGTSEIVVTATSNGKEVKETIQVDVKTPTGISSIADQSFVQLYPNPTKGKVELKLSQVSKAGTMITVYNHVGQVILKTVAGSMNVNLDLSGNPAGMYFINVGQKTVKLVVE